MKGKCFLSADACVWLHVDVIQQLQVCRHCICHVEMQQVSLLFDTTVMMFYIKWSTLDSHPLSVLFFLFSFWVNPLSFYCCKHLANEPILRQWPLLPIKALKPAEDLLGQETREKERERQRSISGQQTKKNDWGDLVRPWCGLCTLRNIYSRLWSPRAHKPLRVSAMSVWPLNQALQCSLGSPEKLHC